MQYDLIFTSLWHGVIYAVITFVFMVIAKKLADHRTDKFDDDYEVAENSNAAVGFRRFGLYLAYAIAFAGTLSGESTSFSKDVWSLVVDGILITVFLFTARAINDGIMLSNIRNDDAVMNGNTAVGLAECGMYIGTGFILNGAFSGGDSNIIAGAWSSLVFFVLGQVALLILGGFYEIITPFNVRNEIKRGNVAAGVAFAGMMTALGIILRSSIAGPSLGWSTDLISFGLYTIFGIILLLIFRKLIDRFLLPTTDLAIEVARDQNVAALVLTQAGIIAVAVIIGAVM